VANLPSDAATIRAVHPPSQWSTEAYMLAGVIDLLAVANWQRSGKKSQPKPKAVKRPTDKGKYGTPHSVDDFEAIYARAMSRVDSGEVAWR